MDEFGTALVKVMALAGGAVLGALMARWLEEKISEQSAKGFDYDKSRYAQGLAPLPAQQPIIEERPDYSDDL